MFEDQGRISWAFGRGQGDGLGSIKDKLEPQGQPPAEVSHGEIENVARTLTTK